MEREYYIWTAGASTVRVYLAADVIARLRDAAAPDPPDSERVRVEIGGILLGHRESDDSVSIDAFELVRSEYRRGMTFTLSATDKRKLGQQIRAAHRGLQPVGSFRTHLRQGLYMDRYDFDLMSEHFPASTDVMLLIRQTDWHAGFFVWEEGDICRQKSYAEFPFDAAALPLIAHKGIEAVKPQATMATQQTPAPALLSTQKVPTLMKVGLVAATAGLAAVLAFYTHEHRAPNTPNTTLPPVSLTSNRTDPPRVVALNPPVDPDISTPDINQPHNQYELHVKIPAKPSPFAKPKPRTEAAFVPVQPPPPHQPATLPQPATPPESLQPIPTASNTPPPIVAPTVLRPLPPTLVSEVSLEPTQPGVLRRGIHRVPVLNLFDRNHYRSGSDFSPARPVRQVKPRLPEELQGDNESHPDVAVKVWIDDTGQVTKAELLSDDVAPQIAQIASNAAYKWTFAPARLSDKPVSSEMMMHFRFVPKQNY